MNMYDGIEFDFAKAKQQASEIDQIADELSALAAHKFEGTMQTLSSNWKGDSAKAYLNKGVKLQSHITKSAKNLNIVANNIRTVARKIYEAEMEAKRIAELRHHSKK